jgi:hypothetical protein
MRLLEEVENKISLLNAMDVGIITDGYVVIAKLSKDQDLFDKAVLISYALGRGYNILIGGEYVIRDTTECGGVIKGGETEWTNEHV